MKWRGRFKDFIVNLDRERDIDDAVPFLKKCHGISG